MTCRRGGVSKVWRVIVNVLAGLTCLGHHRGRCGRCAQLPCRPSLACPLSLLGPPHGEHLEREREQRRGTAIDGWGRPRIGHVHLGILWNTVGESRYVAGSATGGMEVVSC